MSRWTYDVYVSYRVEDTRRNFVDHLYNAFKQNGIHAFRDDDSELRRGEDLYLYKAVKAIEKSRILMVIFSKNYASSSWCLRELVEILSANNPKPKVLPIYYYVKPEVVRKQTESYAEAFDKNEVANRAEVDGWREALSKAATFSGWDLNDTTIGYEDKFIDCISKEIRKMLSDVPLYAGIPKHKSELNYLYPYRVKRRLAIFWDVENCCIPIGICPGVVFSNILACLQHQTEILWDIKFSQYANVNNLSQDIRDAFPQRAGLLLTHIPYECSTTMIVDMFLYALDNPPPSSIMLISGDVSFSNALHVLRQRQFPIFLISSSRVGDLCDLGNATTNIWDWSNVVHGEGLVPTSRYEDKFIDCISKEIRRMLSDVPLYAGIPEHKSESNYHHPYCSKRRLAILWDMENCCIPNGIHPKDVPRNILAYLQRQTEIQWEVFMFFAYADISNFSKNIKDVFESAGIKLTHAPNGCKDAIAKAMTVDLFLYAFDNSPPSSIMMISGNVGVSEALFSLRVRRYPVFLVVPSKGVPLSYRNIGNTIWDWSDVVCGEGLELVN